MGKQDVIQFEDVNLRVAIAIFSWRYPRVLWSDPLFEGERDDCLALAVQFRQMFLKDHKPEQVILWAIPSGHGIDQRWRQSFVATKMAEVLSELAAGVPFKSLDAGDRAHVKTYAEQTVDDMVTYFEGPIDTGANYQPHKEYDPSETDFDGRTADEVNR